VFWSAIVRIDWGFRVSIIGLARIPAVRASSLMAATFVTVVSGVVLGGSWALMMSLCRELQFSPAVVFQGLVWLFGRSMRRRTARAEDEKGWS